MAELLASKPVPTLLRKDATVSLRRNSACRHLTAGQQRLLLDYIDMHLADGVTLDAMAAALNMGACTFARQFKRSFGMAPYAFVLERRLERARRLLKETAMPAKEVACSCGFSDQAHLTRLFSRRYETTPSAFRKSR